MSEAVEREPEPWFVQPELWFAASMVGVGAPIVLLVVWASSRPLGRR